MYSLSLNVVITRVNGSLAGFFPLHWLKGTWVDTPLASCTYEHHTDLQPSLCLTAEIQKIRQKMVVAQYVKWLLLIVVLVWFGFFHSKSILKRYIWKSEIIVRGEEECLSGDWTYIAN